MNLIVTLSEAKGLARNLARHLHLRAVQVCFAPLSMTAGGDNVR